MRNIRRLKHYLIGFVKKQPSGILKKKRINAANKIQKITRGAVVFEVSTNAKAFKGNAISLLVKSKTIGSAMATDIDSFAARAYLMARRKIPRNSEFKIWGSVSFDWISAGGDISFINKSTTTQF